MKIIFRIMMILFLIFLIMGSNSWVALAKTTVPSQPPNSEVKGVGESLSNDLTKAKEHFKTGLEYSRSGKVDLAIKEYQLSLEYDPNLAMAYVNLGMSYIQKKELPLAVEQLKKAIEKSPKLKLAHLNLWWAYRQQEEHDLGIAELKKVIEIDPNEVDAYKNLGDSYLSDKRMFIEAINAYSKGLSKRSKDLDFYLKIGKAYELNKDWDKAIKNFQHAVELKKDNPYSYLFLYTALRKAGKKAESGEVIKKALSILKENSLSMSLSPDIINILEYFGGTCEQKNILAFAHPVSQCQASYYVGLNYLFENNPEKAAFYFSQAIDQAKKADLTFLSEYEYAKIELSLIKKDLIKEKKK